MMLRFRPSNCAAKRGKNLYLFFYLCLYNCLITHIHSLEDFMAKKILKNPYFIAAVIIFFLVLFVGAFGVKLTWSESLTLAAVVTVVGVGTFWARDYII